MRRFSASVALVSLILFASPLFAASFNWIGALGDSWNDAGNWLEGVVPGVDDDVAFNASTVVNQLAQLGGDQAVHGISFGSFTSSMTIAAGGTLSIGSGGITLTAATAPSHTINADLHLTAPQTWNIATSKTLTCNGNISGTVGLVKAGSGLLALGRDNSLSGAVRITGGQLRLDNAKALQNCTVDLASGDLGMLTFGAAGEYVLGGLTGSRYIVFPAGFTLAVGNNNETTTYSGVLGNNGAGNFKKIGSGALTLMNIQAFTGTTRLCDGVLRTVANNLQSSTLDMQAGDVGTLESVSGSPLTIGGLQGTRGLAFSTSLPGLIVGYKNTSTTYSGSLAGTAALFQKIGSGTLTLAGNNTFSGTVQIANGVLRLAHPNALQNAMLDMRAADSGTLDLPAGTEYVLGGLTGGRNIYVPSGTTLNVGNANLTTTYSAGFDGSGTLKKVGTAKLTLNANSSFSGTVCLVAGGLRVNSAALQYAMLDLQYPDAGTLESNNGGQVILGGLQGTGSLAFSSSLTSLTVGNRNLDSTYSGSLTGTTGSFQKAGYATLTLAGDNSFAGTVRIANGTLRLAHPNALANCTLNMATADNGSLTFASGGEYVVSALVGSRTIAIPADTTLAIGNNDATATYYGALSGAGHLTKIGAGTANLSGTCSLRGLTRPAAGLLQVGSTSLQLSTLDLRAGDTGIIDATGSGPAGIGGLQGTRDWAPADFASEVDVGFNNADTTYSGILSGATGTLAKYGTGTLTLSGTNTYSGTTRIVYGKIALANPKALQFSVIDLSYGADTGALQFLPGTENFLGGIIGNRTLDIPAGVTLCIDAHDTIFQGILSGAGDLNVRDSTFTLTGNNTFTGVTRIPSGTLQAVMSALQYSTLDLNAADHGLLVPYSTSFLTLGGLKGSRNLSLSAPASFMLSIGKNDSDTTYSGSITGNSVVFWKIGNGNLTLSGANSFTGVTRVSSGMLTLANPNALKNSAVEMNIAETGTLQFLPGAEYTIAGLLGARNLNIPADTTLRVANAVAGGYGGVLGGEGNFIKAGTGSFSLGGCELTGTVRVAAGVLKVGSGSLKKTTLDLRADDAGTIDSTGMVASVGALRGSRDLTFAVEALGGLSIGYLNADCTYSGSLSGIGWLEKVGLGKLTLTGDSDFMGSVVVRSGVLEVDGSVPNTQLLESGTLTGTGFAGSVSVSAFCHVAPGDSGAGVLHVGDMTLTPSAKLDYDLSAIGASDLISMPASTLTLGGTLQFADFTFNPLDGFGPGTYVLIDAGSVSGGLGEWPSGTIGSYAAEISISGNDVVLTVVPEPSMLAMLAAVLFGLAYLVRRPK